MSGPAPDAAVAKAQLTVCFLGPPEPNALASVAFAGEVRVLETTGGAPPEAAQVRAAVAGARYPVVLLLAGDEVASPALAAEIGSLLARAPKAVAYRVPRRGQYLGRAVACPDWQGVGSIRLLDRRAAMGVDDRAAPAIKRPAGELRGEILVSGSMSLQSMLRDLAGASREVGGGSPSAVQLVTAPFFELWRSFWRRGGFGGGRAGFFLAAMDSLYVLVRLARRYARAERAAGAAPASQA
jgi:hypothetical protein